MATEPTVPFVDLGAQYRAVGPAVRTAINGVLERGDFILGGAVAEFEERFASYTGTRYGIGLDSGLSAIELGLRALGIGPGDEVITAANTFIASALPVTYLGAKPVLVDADEYTFNIDVEQIERAITPRTKAIMPVHLYGQVANMDAILKTAERHGLLVFEDACQAHGASYKGRPAGSMGHAAAFSFYPAKNLGAYGDGGMLVTNDPNVDQQVRLLRNYGSKVKYRHEIVGMNHRLDTLQAAVLMVKLEHLDDWNTSRRRHAARYGELLREDVVALPGSTSGNEHVYHLYVVRSRQRDELQAHLAAVGISTGIHYPIPIHLQPAYKELGHTAGDFPVTERLAAEILSLPMYPELSEESICAVADAVNSFDGVETSSAPRPTPTAIASSAER